MPDYPDKNCCNIFIIIINFDSADSLENCLFLLQKIQAVISVDLCVIDNNSPQRDIESLPPQFPGCKILLSQRESWFS